MEEAQQQQPQDPSQHDHPPEGDSSYQYGDEGGGDDDYYHEDGGGDGGDEDMHQENDGQQGYYQQQQSGDDQQQQQHNNDANHLQTFQHNTNNTKGNENETITYNIYVGNLNNQVDELDLSTTFAGCGEIVSTRVFREKNTGEHMVFPCFFSTVENLIVNFDTGLWVCSLCYKRSTNEGPNT